MSILTCAARIAQVVQLIILLGYLSSNVCPNGLISCRLSSRGRDIASHMLPQRTKMQSGLLPTATPLSCSTLPGLDHEALDHQALSRASSRNVPWRGILMHCLREMFLTSSDMSEMVEEGGSAIFQDSGVRDLPLLRPVFPPSPHSRPGNLSKTY